MTPTTGGDVDELIESLRVVARPHHALRTARTDAWQPSCTTQNDTLVRNPTATPRTNPSHHHALDHARPNTLDKPRSFTDAALPWRQQLTYCGVRSLSRGVGTSPVTQPIPR